MEKKIFMFLRHTHLYATERYSYWISGSERNGTIDWFLQLRRGVFFVSSLTSVSNKKNFTIKSARPVFFTRTRFRPANRIAVFGTLNGMVIFRFTLFLSILRPCVCVYKNSHRCRRNVRVFTESWIPEKKKENRWDEIRRHSAGRII